MKLTAVVLLTCSVSVFGVERVSIPSQDGRLTLPGYWFKAGTQTPRPAVISLHGCNGALDARGELNPVWHRDASYFNDEEMHFLVLDSFTPRAASSICEIPASRRNIREEHRRDDVFAAIQWLARQPEVDKERIVVIGRSHGGSTVLSVLDRTDKAVQAQALQPRAAVALYPGCRGFLGMWNYELSAPLLLLAGELDDWTPAQECISLADKVKRAQSGAPIEVTVYPGSHHGFDGIGPVTVRDNVANTRSGKATVGGDPEARQKSHRRQFDFLSANLALPLRLTHEERLSGHRYQLPPATGFAAIDDLASVPLRENGRARYAHYLGLSRPKAFAITEKGGWYFSEGDRGAMKTAMEHCRKANIRCWLYAVDDRVVWSPEASDRFDATKLQANRP